MQSSQAVVTRRFDIQLSYHKHYTPRWRFRTYRLQRKSVHIY